MGLIHKIHTSTKTSVKHHSASLHMTTVVGSQEKADEAIEELEAAGHTVHGCLVSEETEAERVAREERPWPEGKRHKYRWGRG